MLACGAGGFVLIREGAEQPPTLTIDTAIDAAAADSLDADFQPIALSRSADRPIYRYSVIPGGAYDDRELQEAVQRDPVVAAVYREAAASGVHPETVPADRLAYMSYRVGDEIYWTKHQVRLRRGETILTNGDVELRGRCGNAISPDPMLPTSDAEPSAAELEAITTPQPRIIASRPLAFDYLRGTYGMPLGFAPTGGGTSGFGSAGPLGGWIETPSSLSDTSSDLLLPEVLFPPDSDDEPVWFAPGDAPGSSAASPDSNTIGFEVGPQAPYSGEPPTSVIRVPGRLDTPSDGIDSVCGDNELSCDTTTPDIPTAPVPTPEPGTVLLLGGGLAGFVARKLRSRP